MTDITQKSTYLLRNPNSFSPEWLTMIGSLDVFVDHSKSFEAFLEKNGEVATAKKSGVRRRGVHKIVPHVRRDLPLLIIVI